ncbi:MAG: hypothetical protein CL608_26145 [Anaerolineaceae bacterium]|nr:hypothetical protein [Anaerolineaceae bacterium]
MAPIRSNTQPDLIIRLLQPNDGPELIQLFESSPDNGRFAINARYQIDPYQAIHALHSDTIGIAAEIQGSLVGLGLVEFGDCCVRGERRPYASLHSLLVHPSYRNKGIAKRLAQERITLARERIGESGLILASIQENNSASLSVAQKWSQQQVGSIQSILTRVRNQAPAPSPEGITVRPAQPGEYAEIATGLNRFYQGYDLYELQTAESLSAWLNKTPFDDPLRHYFIAVNRDEEIMAGLAVTRQCQIMAMEVKRMPLPLTMLNKIMKMVPEDGVLRQLSVTRVWYAPEQLTAAQHLWETVRWQSRVWGTHITCFYDPRSSVPDVLRVSKWLPRANFTVVSTGSQPIGGERLIYPL